MEHEIVEKAKSIVTFYIITTVVIDGDWMEWSGNGEEKLMEFDLPRYDFSFFFTLPGVEKKKN
jgi:hypothetical protein